MSLIKYVKDKYDNSETIFIREVTQKDIVTEPYLWTLCEQNACGCYGSNWMCPPGLGTYEDVNSKLLSCGDGFILQMVFQLEDSYDIEGAKRTIEIFNAKIDEVLDYISQHIPKSKILCLGIGGCMVCDTCTMSTGEPCKYPDRARASVEAYGIEVSSTISNVGLEYNNGVNTISTVALFLERQ